MGFVVPNGLDPRDEAYLKRICLMQLYNQNEEIFQAVAIFMYGEYVYKLGGAQGINEFWTYCSLLGMRLCDPPGRRAQNQQKHMAEQDLMMAIWTHLEDRGIVKGSPQDSMKTVSEHCELFAQFIAIQTFDDDPQIGADELIKARAVLDSLAKGRRKINPVPVGNPFGRKGPKTC